MFALSISQFQFVTKKIMQFAEDLEKKNKIRYVVKNSKLFSTKEEIVESLSNSPVQPALGEPDLVGGLD